MSHPATNRRATNVRHRKKQQQHLLDVKIRASTERKRMIAKIVGITMRLLLLAGLAGGSWWSGREALRRFVFENPDYAIREVKFVTDGTLTREHVLKTGDLAEGRNIFLVNLGNARSEIEKMPQVENVEVTRSLPNRLSVTVTERQPIAWVVRTATEDPTTSEKAFLIDARGMLMKSRAKLEQHLHFPVISGVQTENFVAGQRVATSEMQAALQLIQCTAESTRFQARHIDLSKGYCLVVTAHSHAKVTFGLDRIEAQLGRLHRYLARAADDMMEIQTVNLIVERNTPVTFVEPVPAEGEAPAAAKPADSKGKSTPPPSSEKKSAPPVPPPPRAVAVATPVPVAVPVAKPTFFPNSAKSKPTPTPAPPRAEAVQKKPFRIR